MWCGARRRAGCAQNIPASAPAGHTEQARRRVCWISLFTPSQTSTQRPAHARDDHRHIEHTRQIPHRTACIAPPATSERNHAARQKTPLIWARKVRKQFREPHSRGLLDRLPPGSSRRTRTLTGPSFALRVLASGVRAPIPRRPSASLRHATHARPAMPDHARGLEHIPTRTPLQTADHRA